MRERERKMRECWQHAGQRDSSVRLPVQTPTQRQRRSEKRAENKVGRPLKAGKHIGHPVSLWGSVTNRAGVCGAAATINLSIYLSVCLSVYLSVLNEKSSPHMRGSVQCYMRGVCRPI